MKIVFIPNSLKQIPTFELYYHAKVYIVRVFSFNSSVLELLGHLLYLFPHVAK